MLYLVRVFRGACGGGGGGGGGGSARLAPRKWPCQVRQRAARPRKAAPSDVLYLLSVRLRWAGGCSGRKLLRQKSSAPRKVPSKVHMLLLSTMRAIPFSSLLCSHPAAVLAPVRRSISSVSTVAPEITTAVTWASGSLTFRPHGTRSTLPRTGTCASAWLVPQRTRRSRTTFC